MKTSIFLLALLLFQAAELSAQELAKPDYSKMSKGSANWFAGDVFVDNLDTDSTLDFLSSNVYFEPGARSNWHSHLGRQVILAIGGEGYYKEKGKPLRKLIKGDVVVIEPNTIHSHGSLNGKRFCQSVTMTTITPVNYTTWMNKITDQELAEKTITSTYTRIAKLMIDPMQLPAYIAILKEGMEAAVRVEPGVLALRAVQEIKNPASVTLMEIYASKEAYELHIKSPHFLKYKNGTLAMVKSLELIDVMPIALESKPAW